MNAIILEDYTTEIAYAAALLQQASQSGVPCAPLHDFLPKDSVELGYAIQNLNTEHYIKAGRKLVGRKIGLTSVAVQTQLGVNQPDFGMLFSDMCFSNTDAIPANRLLQPKIEGEIAFVLGRDLDSENLTHADLRQSIDYALSAFEIVDSRIRNWQIGLLDTIADNASSGCYVLGSQPIIVDRLDLESCQMQITENGKTLSTGSGRECMGNPLNAALWLAQKMVDVGYPLQAGDIILSGALGPMVDVERGKTYQLSITGLDKVETTVL